eukprot:6212870-Pleurochrysis_carterae.AAC.2
MTWGGRLWRGLPTAARLLAPLIVLLAQSPFTHLPSGTAISPLQVMAKFLASEAQKGRQRSKLLVDTCKSLLLPGNLLRTPDPFHANATEVWHAGLELATRKMDSYQSIAHPEMLMGGAWCIVFGCVLSLLLRRVHLLQLFGFSLFGGSMYMNSLSPTIQFGFCLMCAIQQMHKQAEKRRQLADQAAAEEEITGNKKDSDTAASASKKGKKKGKGE